MVWSVLLTNILIGVGTALIGVIGKAIHDWGKTMEKEEDREAKFAEDRVINNATYDAKSALETAVASVGTTFIDGVKAGAADGKLSKSEIETARDMAISEATELLVGPALEILSFWSRDAIVTIINSIVARNKPSSTTAGPPILSI